MDVPIYAMAAGDGFGAGSERVWRDTLRFTITMENWVATGSAYTAYFFSALWFAGGVYLAGGAHIVRAQ
jgi:hypothetical protein